MRVLVATTATQGQRPTDFDLVLHPELVQLAPVRGRDGGDPDGACGCERAFIGIRSRRPVTTAAVTEREMTPQQYRSRLRHAYRLTLHRDTSEDEIHQLADTTAATLEKTADALLVGTVLERRGDALLVRGLLPDAGQSHGGLVPAADNPGQDNGFVGISGEEMFPAWVSPNQRWHGFAVPTFSRAAAERVVDWTNALHAKYGEGGAFASWEGDDILWYEDDWESDGPTRIVADQYGRYAIGDGWCWQDDRCWTCQEPARPGVDENSRVLLHKPGCPSVPADQWPLAAHKSS